MGKIALGNSDLAVVTSDNPRTEEPEMIIKDITAGMGGGNYIVEPDREKAVSLAVSKASSGDIVVLAGKGHEDYQEIDHKHYPMDERVIVAEHLKETQK